MNPDPTLEAKQQQEEESKLAAIKASMTDEQIEDVIESTKKLKAAQAAEDTPEAKASIPRLSLADLDRKAREIPVDVTTEKGKTYVGDQCFTLNKRSYLSTCCFIFFLINRGYSFGARTPHQRHPVC